MFLEASFVNEQKRKCVKQKKKAFFKCFQHRCKVSAIRHEEVTHANNAEAVSFKNEFQHLKIIMKATFRNMFFSVVNNLENNAQVDLYNQSRRQPA